MSDLHREALVGCLPQPMQDVIGDQAAQWPGDAYLQLLAAVYGEGSSVEWVVSSNAQFPPGEAQGPQAQAFIAGLPRPEGAEGSGDLSADVKDRAARLKTVAASVGRALKINWMTRVSEETLFGLPEAARIEVAGNMIEANGPASHRDYQIATTTIPGELGGTTIIGRNRDGTFFAYQETDRVVRERGNRGEITAVEPGEARFVTGEEAEELLNLWRGIGCLSVDASTTRLASIGAES